MRYFYFVSPSNKHFFEQCFFDAVQFIELMLIEGDEGVEGGKVMTYLGYFTAAGDCYSECFNFIGI